MASAEVVPAGGLQMHMGQVWEVVRENRDLNLPATKVMVATVRCEEIAAAALDGFAQEEVKMRSK
eukprot:3910149-Pyramimonas_sp.AAC.1